MENILSHPAVSDTTLPAVSSDQVALLAALSQPMLPEDAIALRKMVAAFFADKLREEMTRIAAEQQWPAGYPDAFVNEHHRTPYPQG